MTTSLRVDGRELLNGAIPEIMFTVSRAEPNRRPRGLRPGNDTPLQSKRTFTYYGGKRLDPARWEDRRPEATRWTAAAAVASDRWADEAGASASQIVETAAGVRRLSIATPLATTAWGRLTVTACYETYEGYPVVRKWLEIQEYGDRWLKLDHLTIDALRLAEAYRHPVPMTPAELGAPASVLGWGDAAASCGVIAASEVPSGVPRHGRRRVDGLQPGVVRVGAGARRNVCLQPVFVLAYAGRVEQTLSARSTPLDRAVEGPYMHFLHQHVGIAADHAPFVWPQWLTWAVFKYHIDDKLMRTQPRWPPRPALPRCSSTTAGKGIAWAPRSIEPSSPTWPAHRSTSVARAFAGTVAVVHSL